MNDLRLAVTLQARSAVRYTPAGVAVVELELRHVGAVLEGGLPRSLDYTVPARAVGAIAPRLAAEPLGAVLKVAGFLAPSRAGSTRLLVHVTDYAREPDAPAAAAAHDSNTNTNTNPNPDPIPGSN